MNFYTVAESPLGQLLLVSDGDSLTGLYLPIQKHGRMIEPEWQDNQHVAPFPLVRQQLVEYFSGQRTSFDLPLASHGTQFQKQVWESLLAVPFGSTCSYKDIAMKINKPKSVRAVGQANGHNPISIIIPCHRVIGSDGKLTGYGGGLERKAALLDFERAVTANGPLPFARFIQNIRS